MTTLIITALALIAYLLGSVSFAYLAGRAHGLDLRQHGSGNLGANNAGRVLGRRWFFIVFLLDVAKGAVAVLAARFAPGLLGHDLGSARVWLELGCALAVVFGHAFTVFHGLRGGKAVATSLGVMAALVPMVAGLSFLFWIICWDLGARIRRVKRTESVGLASVLAALAIPVLHLSLAAEARTGAGAPLTGFLVLLSALVVVRHRSNLAALFVRRKDAAAPASPERPAT